MLRLERTWSLDHLRLRQQELRFGQGVAMLQDHEGFRCHELPRAAIQGWSRVRVVLRGRALVGETWVQPGGVLLESGWGGLRCHDATP
nr:hypothetical protein [Polyangiaceae bacterium]